MQILEDFSKKIINNDPLRNGVHRLQALFVFLSQSLLGYWLS